MSDDGEKSKENQKSKDENNERQPKNQRKETDREEIENESEVERAKSNTRNYSEVSSVEPVSSVSTSGTYEEQLKEKRPSRRSHIYLLQESSPSAKRTCHEPPTANVNVKARKKLIIASFLCVIFIIVTVVGGVLSNSLAVAADAAHTLTDFAGFMISLFAIWLAGRKPTEKLTFGWYRAEVIGALASVMTIWAVTAVLVWLAIQRCIDRNFEIETIIMMVTALFGIVTNIILGIVLTWGSSKTETSCDANGNGTVGHNHFGWLKKLWRKLTCSKNKDDEQRTVTVECQVDASEHHNINIRSAILHVVTDALQSAGVLIAAIIIHIRPDWVIADPICTFLFAVLVIFSTFKIMKDIGLVLMEGTPKFVDYQEVQTILENIEGVKSVHSLRIWALNVNKIALSAHLVAYANSDPTSILRKAEQAIHKRYKLYETTIQIEEEGEHS